MNQTVRGSECFDYKQLIYLNIFLSILMEATDILIRDCYLKRFSSNEIFIYSI